MAEENTMHLSIETIEAIAREAKKIKEANPKMSNIVKIVKTAWRQDEGEDKVEHSLLPEVLTYEIIEG